jgi:hypothetical protein
MLVLLEKKVLMELVVKLMPTVVPVLLEKRVQLELAVLLHVLSN